MRKLQSQDSRLITGRGLVYFFGGDQMPEGMTDPYAFVGKEVVIDGASFTVLGVESFAIPRSPEHPYRLSFGLQVRA